MAYDVNRLYTIKDVAERLSMSTNGLYGLLSRRREQLGPPKYRGKVRLLTDKDFRLLLILSVHDTRHGRIQQMSRKK